MSLKGSSRRIVIVDSQSGTVAEMGTSLSLALACAHETAREGTYYVQYFVRRAQGTHTSAPNAHQNTKTPKHQNTPLKRGQAHRLRLVRQIGGKIEARVETRI